MRILGPIVHPFVLTMIANAKPQFPFGRTIRTQLVGDHDTGRSTLARQKFAYETLGSLGIAAFLHQNLQHKAILINGTPQKMLLALDRDNHFIQVPFVTKSRGTPTDRVGIGAAELLSPFPHRFVGDDDPSVSKHIFDHAKTEWKAIIQPHCLSDDLSGETMTVIKRAAWFGHASLISVKS
jgi:hypothetical protein